MTKINHERPSLRYLDNIRRELKHMATGATTCDFLPSNYQEKVDAVLLAQENRPQMPSLTKNESNLALTLLEKLNAYIEASSAVIESLITRKKGRSETAKEQLDHAEKELLVACRKFCITLIITSNNGRDNLQDWYRYLKAAFDENNDAGSGSSWETLNWAMEEASKPLIAAAEEALRRVNDEGL